MDGPAQRCFHRPQVVQGSAGDVEQAAQCFRPHGDGDALAGVNGLDAAGQPVGGAEGQAAHPVVADVLLHFQHQPLAVVVHLHRVEELGQFVGGKLDVNDGSDYLYDSAGSHSLIS